MSKNSSRKPVKAKLLADLKLGGSWDKHINDVRPAIKELDRRRVESVVRAPFIVVTNATK